MNNNHRLHSFSDSCVFMFKKSLGSVVILAALTAFAQAETISLSGGQTDSNARQLLYALRPYLREDRQDKVERALQLARLFHIGKKFLSGWEGFDV